MDCPVVETRAGRVCDCDQRTKGYIKPPGTPNAPHKSVVLRKTNRRSGSHSYICGTVNGWKWAYSHAFTCQIFILDAHVFMWGWPYKLPFGSHIEDLFAATYRDGALPIYLAPDFIGVQKLDTKDTL